MANQSIPLIGMPSAGKTKIGKHLAKILRLPFVDTDDIIVHLFGAEGLQQVVNRLSPSQFADIEARVGALAAHLPRPTVIATGGSMIYAECAMRLFRERTHVVYLKASLPTIERRVAKKPNRGIVFAPGETLADLYARRVPLYQRWAHLAIDADDDDRRKLAGELADILMRKGIAA